MCKEMKKIFYKLEGGEQRRMAVVYRIDKRTGRELSADEMIKKFSKQVQKEGIMNDLREHEFYKTRSQKRAIKHANHLKLLRNK